MSLVIYTDQPQQELEEYLRRISYSTVFWLADSHTAEACSPHVSSLIPKENLIVIPAGEKHKTWESCQHIWDKLLSGRADRQTVLINLGGGMITDLGGFAASVYKRGIRFIHMPTSLLGMVDAAIGGKTGIDYHDYKNIIGSFAFPEATIIFPGFLSSLPARELNAGYAEMLKYGLIRDEAFWSKLKHQPAGEVQDWLPLIKACAEIKSEIVQADQEEKGLRKILNFGHTIGHALESLSLSGQRQPLLHGEAVALGMLTEAFLSQLKMGFPEAQLQDITHHIKKHFLPFPIGEQDYIQLLSFMRQDKKNTSSDIRFALLEHIGKCMYDIPCTEEEIFKAFQFYRQVWNG